MDYELAKLLKEAGFPYQLPPMCRDAHEHNRIDCRFAFYPTLEELISVIPVPDKEVGFISLSFICGEWVCGYEKYEVFDPECSGATPLEAVAKLWLALHPKPLPTSTE